jgi:phosphoglycerol transferase MdoB-like AlkP superfamily enzyme
MSSPDPKRAAFILGLPVIFLYLLLLTLVFKVVFVAANWSSFRLEAFGSIVRALFLGLRFDISILAYLFLPAILLYHAMVITGWRLLKWIGGGYFIMVALIYQVLWFADLQYFEAAGKHFTYEAFLYLGPSVLPMVSGAFKLHPWVSLLSGLAVIGFSFATGCLIGWGMKRCIPDSRVRIPYYLFTLIVFLILDVVGARGGIQKHPLNIGHSTFSPSPYLNALCLNPVYSTFRTMASSSSKQEFRFFDEAFNIRTVRDLLGIGQSEPISADYPLLRISPGTEKGNRKNIVIFILESWTGKSIGCLGSKFKVTPIFDDLSREGMLFTNSFATGVRSIDGIFSTLCSFPTQPLRPTMARSPAYQPYWRSISQILAEAGYYSVFIHGRDLDFDGMHQFMRYINFHKIVDRHGFPQTPSSLSGSWRGYDDEEVMRRADEEFSVQNGRPFLGVIYTMNTHEPFMTPESFPKAFPPTTPLNKYLNSLKYSDHALGVFFSLARKKPYFKDTIFIFVPDHTVRHGDSFNFFDQHHIPLLIYSPGYVSPSINPVVSSQLDILPTILGLLQLKTVHASWGRNLMELPQDQGFAVCMVGHEVRWHDSRFLLNDSLADGPMLLFDIIRDPNCTMDVWRQHPREGDVLKTRVRSYLSLSQTLLYQNRVYPRSSVALIRN